MTQRISIQDPFCTSGNSPTVSLIGPHDAPAVLVLGGISATPDLLWWADLIGPNAPFDPSRNRIISASWLMTPDVTTQAQARWILDALEARGLQGALRGLVAGRHCASGKCGWSGRVYVCESSGQRTLLIPFPYP